jgi:hypothetical protein
MCEETATDKNFHLEPIYGTEEGISYLTATINIKQTKN